MMVSNAIVFATSFVCRCIPRVFILASLSNSVDCIDISAVLISNDKIEAK